MWGPKKFKFPIFNMQMTPSFFARVQKETFVDGGLLSTFLHDLGLSLNIGKSSLVGVNTDSSQLQQLASLLGCQVEDLPFNYLGASMGGNYRKASYWDPIVDKFKKLDS